MLITEANRRRLPRLAGAVLALSLVAPTLSLAQTPAPAMPGNRATPASFADLADRLAPGVVNISTTTAAKQQQQQGQNRGPEMPQFPPGSPFEEFFRDFFDRQQRGQGGESRPRMSLGSGFIIDPAGYIVTNNHVIEGADEISATLHDGAKLKATLIGRDPDTDLALLKVENSKPLPAVGWGDSDRTRIGDWVLAIGNPFGFGGTVTAGIVSARSRNINAGRFDDFIQTDAAINRGNSGGPLFNMAGEIVGVNSAIYSPTGASVGIGFAIPANLARPIIEQLKVNGKVKRGWLGVKIQSVGDEIAEGLGLDRARGALVSSVSEGSPAARAKIEPGDVVLRFDGKEVTDMARLPRIVADTPIGKTVDVAVWRQRKEQTLKVTIAEMKQDEQVAAAATGDDRNRRTPGASAVSALGLQVATINAKLKESFQLDDDASGVVVTEVAGGGPASERGIRPGDVIVEVNQREVKTPGDVSAQVKAAKDEGRKTVLLLLNQKGDTRFVPIPLGG